MQNSFPKLKSLLEKVPPDYYQKGIKNNIFQKIWHERKIKNLQPLIRDKKFKKVLDVGCASGYMTNEVKKIVPNSKVFGVDAYKQAIELAQQLYPGITFIQSNVEKLPFDKNMFDLIISYETIEHVMQPKKMLSEIRRIMKKDSLLILAMDSGNLLFQAIWFFWERTKGKVWHGAHLHPFKSKGLEQLLIDQGFIINNKFFTHWGMEVVFVLKK